MLKLDQKRGLLYAYALVIKKNQTFSNLQSSTNKESNSSNIMLLVFVDSIFMHSELKNKK